MTETEKASRLYDWGNFARPEQLPPLGPWTYWLILAGRGFGKTRAGAEQVRAWARDYDLVNVIGATADDARDIIVEGESGILAICPNKERPTYLPSKRRLEWPNGSKTLIFTADEPERLRGKQHSKLWADELASWRYPEAWLQAMLGLRLGDNPQAVITTTPKPKTIIRQLVSDPDTVVVRGTTYENRENLAGAFYTSIIKQYEGTHVGRQELMGELLDEIPGALWTRMLIEANRVRESPEMSRILVAIDPAVTAKKTSDETGIIVAGRLGDDGYVLEDLSGRYSPEQWGRKAVEAYYRWKADAIIAEVNQGGDMVESNLRMLDPSVSYRAVSAMRGKMVRAEPIGSLYEQGRVHHVGMFAELEDQLCNWDGDTDWSPDRLDAMVHAMSELMLGVVVSTDAEFVATE